jgi:hypothetical protein
MPIPACRAAMLHRYDSAKLFLLRQACFTQQTMPPVKAVST